MGSWPNHLPDRPEPLAAPVSGGGGAGLASGSTDRPLFRAAGSGRSASTAADPRTLGSPSGTWRLDEQALFDYLALGTVTGIEEERSLVAGVVRDTPIDRSPDGLGVGQAPAETFGEALRTAVADACRGRSHVGVLSSGGLDSSVLAALAAELDVEVTLLCAPADLSTRRELALQDEVARHLGCSLIRCTERQPIGPALDRLNSNAPWPTGGLFAGVFAEMADAARAADVQAVLAGDGADDLLTTSGLATADALAARSPRALWRAWADVGPLAERPVRSFAGLGLAPTLAASRPAVADRLVEWATGALPRDQLLQREFTMRLESQRRRARVRQWQGIERGRLAYDAVARDIRAGAEAAYDLPGSEGSWLPRLTPYRSQRVLAAAWRDGILGGPPAAAAVPTKAALRAFAAGLLPERVRLADKDGLWDLPQRLWEAEWPDLSRRLKRLADRLPDVIDTRVHALSPLQLPVDVGPAWVRLLCLDSWIETAPTRFAGLAA